MGVSLELLQEALDGVRETVPVNGATQRHLAGQRIGERPDHTARE